MLEMFKLTCLFLTIEKESFNKMRYTHEYSSALVLLEQF